MTHCANCDKTILMGGVKEPESDRRFCSAGCRFKDFHTKFEAAMAHAVADDPDPLPAQGPAAKDEGPPLDDFGASMVGDGAKDVVIVGLGLGAASAVAILIQTIYSMVHFEFFSLTFWFVVPAGAYLCGMLAGLGFWFALRTFDRLPTPLTWATALMGGALAYVAIYFCLWWGLEIEGKLMRDQVGFIDFLRIFLVNQKIQVGRGAGPVVELGNWGYARFGINLVGFALGVVTMVAIAGGKTYCPKCRRYFKTVGTQVRTSIDPETTAYQLHPVIAGLASGRVQEAVDLHAASGVPGTKGYWTSSVVVEGCPGCGRHHATLTATVPGEKGVDHVEGFRFLGTTDLAVQISA